ncbi:sigma-70 family RNA polymerase sigma factor [Mongoliitalea daihaiensis]|uniref:sigma-70 family RNA polymerase sigma factor n=1 Tax=Mongoliitalea daihaiensis TaxID=2782006 RepID=UPI0021D42A0C|nr:sigma-70 family RNA polymerase sigma factor [Mongoliitalea daihaiensis]
MGNNKQSPNQSTVFDQKTFRKFFEAHFNSVYMRLFFLLNNQEEAEELTQDIFINIWRRRSELLHVENWNAYLLKAATFKAIDYRRKRKENIIYRDQLDLCEIVQEEMEQSSEEDRLDLLQKEIDLLPDRCQIIFKLSRYEQMSYAEIAKNLDISPKTVENQIGKALKILREKLLPQLFFGLLQIFQ